MIEPFKKYDYRKENKKKEEKNTIGIFLNIFPCVGEKLEVCSNHKKWISCFKNI